MVDLVSSISDVAFFMITIFIIYITGVTASLTKIATILFYTYIAADNRRSYFYCFSQTLSNYKVYRYAALSWIDVFDLIDRDELK